jgi:hypothetical protein
MKSRNVREERVPKFPLNLYRGYVRHDFQIGENAVIVVEPKEPAPGRRWVWRAEFFDAFPEFNLEMLGRGWWLGFMSVGNTFGCPSAMKRFDVFYQEMTETYGFHKRPVLEGLSRGGLYVYNWAAANVDKVGMVYADNPVCDFRSWPGGKRKETDRGQADNWQALLKCYGFASEAEALAWPGNPVDNVAPLVKAGIPLVHSFGDADEVVPWEDNTKVLAERVAALGGTIKLFRKPGCRHHPHGPEDPKAFADWVLANVRE